MPNYVVKAPDGSLHVIAGPDEAVQAGAVSTPSPQDEQSQAAIRPQAFDAPPSTAHTLGVAASSLPRGLLSMMQMLGEGSAAATDRRHGADFDPAKSAQADAQINQQIQGIGVQPTPGSTSERYINAAGEGIGALPAGGPLGPETSVVRALATAGLGGVGGEAGGQLSGGNPFARIVGALMGGVTPNALEKLVLRPNNAQAMAQKALKPLSNSGPAPDFEHTQALGNQATAAQQGIPQTAAQAYENAPDLQNLQRSVATSGNAPLTNTLLNKQPGVAVSKAEGAIGALPGEIKEPTAVANQTQQAATDAIGAQIDSAGQAFRQTLKDQGGTSLLTDKQVAPFARWLKTLVQANPNSGVSAIAEDALDAIRNPAAKAAAEAKPANGLVTTGGQPLSQAVAAKEPQFISDPLALKQAVDYALRGAGQRMLNTKVPVDTRAAAQIRTQLNAMFEKTTPALTAANAAYEGVMKNVVNPLKEGPVGQVAGRAGAQEGVAAPNKITAILDKGTVPGAQTSPILTVARTMNSADPTAFPTAVKTNLATKLAQSTTTSAGQTESASIGAFYDSIYGNAAQKKGLQEQLVGVARAQGLSDNALYPGFLRLMDTFGRLAKRDNSSAVTSPQQFAAMAGSNPASNFLRLFGLRAAAAPLEARYAGGIPRLGIKGSMNKLDDILSSPEGVQLLRKLAANDPLGKVGQQAIISFLAAHPEAGAEQNQK